MSDSDEAWMISRIHLSTIILLAALIWAVLLLLEGVAVSPQWLHPFKMVVWTLVILLAVFDRWAWRFPLLHPWFVSQPNLRGTWKTVLQSNWINPETGQGIGPIEAYIVIRQTFSSLHMRILTRESASESLAAALVRAADGTWSVVTVYRNTPAALILDRSRRHFGGLILNVRGLLPYALDGQYWTDRNTRGDMRLTATSRKLLDDFDTASGADYKARNRS